MPPKGVVDARIQRRPADVPDPRLGPAGGLQGRLRPRTTPPTATRSCSCASIPNRARRRCCRSPATCWSTSPPTAGQTTPDEKINAAYTIGSKLGATRRRDADWRPKRSSAKCSPAEAERHRRRQLQGLHQSRRHARLRVRERRPPLLQRERSAPPKPTTRASTCSPATRSSATKTRSTMSATGTPTRTSCAWPASRTSCATCASRSRPATSSARSTRSPKAVGHAIATTFHASASELIELAKLVAFSQHKPLRQVKFRTSNVERHDRRGGSYVTSTPALEQATLEEFLHGHERPSLPDGHSPLPLLPPHTPQPLQLERRLRADRWTSTRPPPPASDEAVERRRQRALPGPVPGPADGTGRTAGGAPVSRSRTSRATSTTPTWSCGGRTRSAATTTSRARTG